MSEPAVVDTPAGEATPEVQQAYQALLESFGGFLLAFEAASALGIDAGRAISSHLREVMPPEAWEQMPAPLRMMLG